MKVETNSTYNTSEKPSVNPSGKKWLDWVIAKKTKKLQSIMDDIKSDTESFLMTKGDLKEQLLPVAKEIKNPNTTADIITKKMDSLLKTSTLTTQERVILERIRDNAQLFVKERSTLDSIRQRINN